MQRITPTPFRNPAGKNVFGEGDPVEGTPPTIMTAKWANDVQEELCRVLESNGIPLDADNQGQLAELLRTFDNPPVAVANLRQVTLPVETGADSVFFGDPDGNIIAVAETSIGLAVFRSDGRLGLISGGHMMWLADDGGNVGWAVLRTIKVYQGDGTFEERLYRAIPSDGCITVEYWVVGWAGEGGWTLYGRTTVAQLDLAEGIPDEAGQTRSVVAADFVDDRHMVIIRRVAVGTESAYVQAIAWWLGFPAGLCIAELGVLQLTAPFEAAPGVDCFNRAQIACSSAEGFVAALLPDIDGGLLLARGLLVEPSIIQQLPPAVSNRSTTPVAAQMPVTTFFGQQIDQGARLGWSESLAQYYWYEPGGTRIQLFQPILAEGTNVVALDGRTVVDLLETAEGLGIVGALGDALHLGLLGPVSPRVAWAQQAEVPELATVLACRAYFAAGWGGAFSPMPRYGHAVTRVGGAHVLFAGGEAMASQGLLRRRWSSPVQVGSAVFALGADGSGRVVAVGGSNQGPLFVSDVAS